MSDGQAMPEVDRPLPGLDAGIISALPFLIEIDVERVDVIRAEPKLPAKFSLHVLVFRMLREDSSLGLALFGLEVEVVVMQQAVRPRQQLLGRHMIAVGDHILDPNLDLDAASVEPHGRGRDLRGGQSAQAGTSHPMSAAARPWPSRAGSVGKAAGAAPSPSLSWSLPATLLATGHWAGLRPSAAQPQPARP